MANAPKGTKRSCPGVRPLAGARCSFVPAFIWGHRLRSASRRPPLDVFDFVERRYAPAPQMNASTQPAEGAGGSRSKAAGELPLGLLSGEERSVYADLLWELACQRRRPDSRPVSFRCTRSTVGAGLPAMAPRQPTSLFQVYPVHCGSWPASDGCLTADQSLAGVPGPLWELACRRWRPGSRPVSFRCTRSTVGAGLPAMAPRQPTSLFLVYPVHCGSWPASDGTLAADQSLSGVPGPLWELACQRWRPDSRPVSFRCTRSTVGAGLPAMAPRQPTNLMQVCTEPCGSWLASEGGLPAGQSVADVQNLIVEASLLRAAFRRWRCVIHINID
ncbi:hypothetical protein SAMN04489798_2225 [Pseudomonas arsenicoxydans]|uniref:Uncharacterized protein n=1 Tax=Pseudomonas arsenicoxydans TaxID=702115 RepID=A0A1H0HDE1_9PSED|nr:hypothetical protein SAMN04489798_2225 [Pseudomonas arsenicoxydans]